MARPVNLQRRKQLVSSTRGVLGLFLVSFFSGITGAFAATNNSPKVKVKKVIVETKQTAVWG